MNDATYARGDTTIVLLDYFSNTSLMAAFLAGLFAALSPAGVALGVSSIVYLIGVSLHELARAGKCESVHSTIVIHALWFLVGFSAIFIGLSASTSVIGSWLASEQVTVRHGGAILVVLFGAYGASGASAFFAAQETQRSIHARLFLYPLSCAAGGTMAASWTPCVGHSLGAALSSLADADTMMDGFVLLSFYSMGFGILLFILSWVLSGIVSRIRCASTMPALKSRFSALLLILVGTALYTDRLTYLAALLRHRGIGISV